MENKFENKVIGSVSVIVENSNHNSDLSGLPRTIDGILSASDVSLKYYIKKFLHNRGFKIFNLKSLDENGKLVDVLARIESVNVKNRRDFFEFKDCKFFGHTILHKGKKGKELPTSTFNGPWQFTFGKNIYSNNSFENHQILNGFPSKTGEDSSEATTIGSCVTVNQANYLHHFDFSPKNLERDILMKTDDFKGNIPYFTHEEVEDMKHAVSNCVGSNGIDGSYLSRSKSNTNIGLCVFITLKKENKYSISIKNDIKCTDKYNEYDLSSLIKKVEKNRDIIEKVELRYTDGLVTFKQDIDELGKDELYTVSDRG